MSDIVTYPLKVRIVEPEDMAIARQWFCKHVSKATKSRDCSNGYATTEKLLEAELEASASLR
jgi:hypothetical protein